MPFGFPEEKEETVVAWVSLNGPVGPEAGWKTRQYVASFSLPHFQNLEPNGHWLALCLRLRNHLVWPYPHLNFYLPGFGVSHSFIQQILVDY